MKLKSFACAVAMPFGAAVAMTPSEPPTKVDVNELFKHPKKYHGKKIEVIGYWVTSCAHCSDLYPSFEEEQRRPYGTFVWLIKVASNVKLPKSKLFRGVVYRGRPNYDGYIHVIGRFEYHPIKVGEIISEPRKPLVPTRQGVAESHEPERAIVTGWNGEPEKQITDIIEMHPIGLPLPSRIEEYDEREMRKAMRAAR